MQKKRFEELEGLRGIAAVVVTIYHFLLAFYLFAFFGPSSGANQHMRFEDNFYGTPLTAFLSGPFAVAIFFVLSGFVLSIAFFQSGKVEVVKKLASKRYLRLMIPALASTVLCFLIITFGTVKVPEVSEITQSSWLASQWQISPTLFDAIKSGVYDIFITRGSPFNTVLWTMQVEFIGSFIIFGSLILFGKLKYRWIAYIFLLAGTFNTWFFAFVAGMILADMYAQHRLELKRRSAFFVASTLSIALFLGGYPILGAENTTIYGIFSTIGPMVDWEIMLVSFGAIVLLLLVLLSTQVSRILAHKMVSGIGKYTFSLYLVHIPVIYTVGFAAFLLSYNAIGLSYNISAVIAFIFTIPSIIGLTLLFERYVDRPSVMLSGRFARIFLEEDTISWSLPVIKEKWNVLKVGWFNNRRRIKETEE